MKICFLFFISSCVIGSEGSPLNNSKTLTPSQSFRLHQPTIETEDIIIPAADNSLLEDDIFTSRRLFCAMITLREAEKHYNAIRGRTPVNKS